MSERSQIRKAIDAVIACAFVGAGAWLLTTWLLGARSGSGEPPPIVFPAAALDDPDPYRADLLAAAHLCRERWSYAEHRATIDGVDLDRRLEQALLRLGDEPDVGAFRDALTFLIAGLHDGHAFAAVPDSGLPGSHRWPFTLREVAEGVMIDGTATDAVAPEGRDAILAGIYADFDRRFGELEPARAIVLDLRGNPGGTDLLGQFVVDRLVDGSCVYFRLEAQGAAGWRSTNGIGSSAPAGEHSVAGRPLAVIVDEQTFSTADNVAACLRDVHPDVRFVGRPNGAGSGAPRSWPLPRTGAVVTFCTHRVRSASGRIIEGQPVAIEHPVTWTRDDVLAGRDPDLAAAIEALVR